MKPLLFVSALLVATSVAAADPVPTVGTVTQSNNRKKDGHLIVRTPSILRVKASSALSADVNAAIANYDRVIELPATPEVRAEAMRRAAYLRLRLADESETPNPALLNQAIAIYQRLFAELPDDAGNDLALYQFARASQAAGSEDAAIDALRRLGARYPDSTLVADARFRAAELLYVRTRYAEAAAEYRALVAGGTATPYFAPAQYKLGWSLYQLHEHEEALAIFLAILDQALPAGTVEDPAAAMAAVAPAKADFASESLRVSSLSFAALGGGKAIDAYFAKHGEPRFAMLSYLSLADALRTQRRYSDAAQVYVTFIERHPQHRLGPELQQRAIAAYQDGGFSVPLIAAKAAYAKRYAPDAAFWTAQKTPAPATVVQTLAQYTEDLGRYYQSDAQQRAAGDAARSTEFVEAADWYRQRLALKIGTPAQQVAIRTLRADALYDGGRTADAADEYLQAAYATPEAQSPEAAYAAVQALQRLSTETKDAAREQALRKSIAASEKLATSFPNHVQWAAVQTRSAQDLFALRDDAAAIKLADATLQSNRPLSASQRRELLTVVGDARYAQKDYANAEAAYVNLMPSLTEPTQRMTVGERLATAIYRQAEAARDAGDLRTAAQSFARVGQRVPDATIRATADYDAAAALIALSDWNGAGTALEGFRSRYPTHALAGEVDKKLAVVYEKSQRPALAADAYQRIAARDGIEPALRVEAAWLAAQRYDDAKMTAAAARAYEGFVRTTVTANVQGLERGLQARRRLADIARDTTRDEPAYRGWLQDIVAVDVRAGNARSDQSKLMAAQASLEIGKLDADAARRIVLTAPLTQQLPQRREKTETAIAALLRAARDGDAAIVTAATYEIGAVYQDLGTALLRSQRPAALSGDASEQYEILLEEQAEPFEKKAIAAYEANLGRVRQGVWNDAIHRSALALVELAPAQYGKNEVREDRYAALP